MDFTAHIHRQLTFSGKTFGPGDRHGGVTDHIGKELIELAAPPDDLEAAVREVMDNDYYNEADSQRVRDILDRRAAARAAVQEPGDPKEWVDVVLLSIDGLWRSLRVRHTMITDWEVAGLAFEMIDSKQTRNEGRDWPDWRTMSSDKAIEHDRTGETPDG